jgi:ABC-2 type transport system ATP-binding protein
MTLFPLALDGPAAIRTAGLVKRYGARRALDGLDLIVPDGSIYLLAGENGAGKSTALRLLLQLEDPTAGTVEVLGNDMRRGAAQTRARIGYIADNGLGAYRGLTAGQMIQYHAQFYPTWDDTYAAHLVRELDIDVSAKLRVLSKGHARRVEFVMALAHRPALLLLDEPTDGLDPLVRDRVLHLLAGHVAEAETTIVIATHLINEVERLADHVGIIRRGKLAAQLTRDQLHGALHRYRFTAPESWQAPSATRAQVIRKATLGREHEWTVWGDPADIHAMLNAAGSPVTSVTPLSLTDAVVALMSLEAA